MRRRLAATVVATALAVCVAPTARIDARQAATRDLPPLMPAGTALIAGVVVADAVGAQPIRRALVTLAGTGGTTKTVTDDAGRFAFDRLAAGRYTITVDKPAFVRTYYGSPRVGRGPAMPIPVGDGQRLTSLRIPLMRGAVVEGTLRDSDGVPLSSGQVRVLQPVFENGERRFVDPPGPTQLATTDDRGVFRLYGLTPGEYTVSAAAGGAGVAHVITPRELEELNRATRPGGAASHPERPAVVEPTYSRAATMFPSSTSAATAQTFVLRAGEEMTGVDVTSVLVPVARVRGMVVGPAGLPDTSGLIGLASLSAGSLLYSPGFLRPDAQGMFTSPGLPAGQYLFFGRAPGPNGEADPFWLSTEVVVGETDVTGTTLQYAPGTPVRGQLQIPASTSFRVADVRIALVPAGPRAEFTVRLQPMSIGADGRFEFRSVGPGSYRLEVATPRGWVPQTATAAGRDWLDATIEIADGAGLEDLVVTVTDRTTEISGSLLDQLGRPAPEYAIVVYPAEPALRVASPRRSSGLVRVGADGQFVVSGLPPGDYLLAAVTDLDPSQLTDPALLEMMSREAIRLRLGEGQHLRQDIKLSGPAER